MENLSSLTNSTQSEVILEVRKLTKSYGRMRVVDDVSFSINRGECFGLLGPNGAGKSTTIEIVEQITTQDSGEILFKGQRPDSRYAEKIGVQFQATALPPHLTVKECIRTFSRLYQRSAPIQELIEMCQIGDFQNQRHDQISGGQRQRLLLAVALCNDPVLLLLDEPTTGLDPQARRNLWSVVEDVKDSGKSIILTTHYMEEADVLCDTVAIMNKGKIIAMGDPAGLLKENFDQVTLTLGYQEKAVSILNNLRNEGDYFQKNGQIIVQTRNVALVLGSLIREKVTLDHLRIRESNLEDLFLKLTGEALNS